MWRNNKWIFLRFFIENYPATPDDMASCNFVNIFPIMWYGSLEFWWFNQIKKFFEKDEDLKTYKILKIYKEITIDW